MVSGIVASVDMYVETEISAYENDPEFIANGWALRVAEEVVTLLRERGETQSLLATNMDVSRARVSAILNAPPNMTFLTLARLSVALGMPTEVVLNPNRQRSLATPSPIEDAVLAKLAADDDRIPFTTPSGRVANSATA